MRTWFAAGGAALLAITGVVLWRSGHATGDPAQLPARAFADVTAPAPEEAAADPAPRRRHYATRAVAPEAPEADPITTQERRLARYDKDRDGAVSLEEYLANRRKSFAKVDANGDGKLSFEEYSAKAEAKFEAADLDHQGKLSPAEFATTAVKHRAHAKCAPPEAREADA